MRGTKIRPGSRPQRTRQKIVVYIAVSVDGYIATPDGGVEWLEAFEGGDYGYDDFLAGIDTVVMGRASFDQVLDFGEWPYGGKKSIVLTHRDPPPGGLPMEIPGLRFMAGEPADLAGEIQAGAAGDIWLMGGAATIRGFLDAGAVETLELFVMPVLLGRGIALFPASSQRETLALTGHQTYANGVVRLEYDLRNA